MKVRKASNGLIYLNVSCGQHYHQEWNNIDIIHSKGVTYHDIRCPFPYESNVFDAVYCSHALEHFHPSDASLVLGHISEVLKPGGVLRIVVPDLEMSCRQYLQNLEAYVQESSKAHLQRYEWSVLELLDQLVRVVPGGGISKYIEEQDFDRAYVEQRWGDEIIDFIRAGSSQPLRRSMLKKLKEKSIRQILSTVFRKVTFGLFQSNDPRKTGEAHKWMYDKVSICLILKQCGFSEFSLKTFDDSNIKDWSIYHLDKSKYGETARKPDSLYVECTKN